MPKGVYERKPKEIPDMASESTTVAAPAAEKPKLFPVVLSKNYCPIGEYEIIGYLRPEIRQKDAAGVDRIIQTEQFIEGEMKPHVSPGVGFGAMKDEKNGLTVNPKIWAGTHVRLPLDEAKRLVSKKLAERADAIAA